MLRPMRSATLIVNPRASGVTPDALDRAAEELRTANRLEIMLSERPSHATELAAAACVEGEAVFALGGDGLLNEVVNGMSGNVPLGLVPGGASNVLTRALGLPRDPLACARRAGASTSTRRISLGRANGRRFCFACGVGLDAELVRAVDGRGRAGGRRAGDLAFVAELTRLLWRRRGRIPPSLTLEGHGRYSLVAVANCNPYTYAGPLPVHVAPEARFELGLDVTAVTNVVPRTIARVAWVVLARPGRQGAVSELISLHDVDRALLHAAEPTPLQMDGEDLGDVTEVEFVAERDALSILV
ncbi:MAG: diacylglycerol kinase family protein, partial [Actinomycetia bacterium]|nr:diacylglycerol kinase family protein [Actinomycetes bacterium]